MPKQGLALIIKDRTEFVSEDVLAEVEKFFTPQKIKFQIIEISEKVTDKNLLGALMGAVQRLSDEVIMFIISNGCSKKQDEQEVKHYLSLDKDTITPTVDLLKGIDSMLPKKVTKYHMYLIVPNTDPSFLREIPKHIQDCTIANNMENLTMQEIEQSRKLIYVTTLFESGYKNIVSRFFRILNNRPKPIDYSSLLIASGLAHSVTLISTPEFNKLITLPHDEARDHSQRLKTYSGADVNIKFKMLQELGLDKMQDFNNIQAEGLSEDAPTQRGLLFIKMCSSYLEVYQQEKQTAVQHREERPDAQLQHAATSTAEQNRNFGGFKKGFLLRK